MIHPIRLSYISMWLFFVSKILKIPLKETRLENVKAVETAVKRVLVNIPKRASFRSHLNVIIDLNIVLTLKKTYFQ